MKAKNTMQLTKKLSDMVSAQTTEFTIGKVSEKPISYVFVKEGILEVRRTKIGLFSKLKTEMNVENLKSIVEGLSKVNGISTEVLKVNESLQDLPSVTTFPKFQLSTPKIPIGIFHQIVAFFRMVHTKQGTEAAALIRWNQERQEYYVEIPGGPTGGKQQLSAGSVKYKPDTNNNDVIVMDIHSHHTMSDFFSSVDDNDEQGIQLYAVVGNIEHSQPTASIRARMYGEDVSTPTVEEIFDVPAVPEDWMNRIEEPAKSIVEDTEYPGYHQRDWRDGTAWDPTMSGTSWGQRAAGESIGDYARRMKKIKDPERRSLPCPQTNEAGAEVPTQKDGESDEEYFKRLQGGSLSVPHGGVPSTGEVLNGSEVLEAQKEIWDVLENELLTRAEIYCHSSTLIALRDYLIDKLNDVSPAELRPWING